MRMIHQMSPGADGTETKKTRQFVDEFGVTFDPEVHATHKNGMPIKNKDGSYRAKPGMKDEVEALKREAAK